ncbi:hypothetical protein A0H81_09908 [Grifola frondosa]|uniref:Uncharacterized protein n=1 Tax=Grifola frondosa TaxID=5627 RepID=A0A1C7LZ81_GRIFR|nr:hypothetical protein A0H81_09908 [Grifola frondosa]
MSSCTLTRLSAFGPSNKKLDKNENRQPSTPACISPEHSSPFRQRMLDIGLLRPISEICTSTVTTSLTGAVNFSECRCRRRSWWGAEDIDIDDINLVSAFLALGHWFLEQKLFAVHNTMVRS